MVQDTGDEFVRVPLGLVALNWLRLYLPLIRESLPQTPTNIGAQGLGFAKEGFQTLLSGMSASDLRVARGSLLSGDRPSMQRFETPPKPSTECRHLHDLPHGRSHSPGRATPPQGPPTVVDLDTATF